MNLSRLSEHRLRPDVVDDTDQNNIYMGYFESGSDRCLIKRVKKETTIDGKLITSIHYPGGLFDFLFNWNDRATLGYRHRGFPKEIIYGYLYNWHTITDKRSITSSDNWLVAKSINYDILFSFSKQGMSNFDAINALKDSGNIYWNHSNGLNTYRFNGRGGGLRSYTGLFSSMKLSSPFHTNDNYLGSTAYGLNLKNFIFPDEGYKWFSDFPNNIKKIGGPIRLIKANTILKHGESGVYIGNDFRPHRTICIGTQEWLADNLAETKYRNGELIPTVADNTAWNLLTTGAKCAYNNNEYYI